MVSYFGDISIYDTEPLQKLDRESAGGCGLILTRYFKSGFAVSGQFLAANMKASMDSISFRTHIYEYNLHCRLNLLKILHANCADKFGWEIYAGVGQFFFSTTNNNDLALINDNSTYQPDKPEFVYFFGSGISYRMTEVISLTADLALRQCQTDRLENIVKNHDYDYYSYLNAGISINVDKIFKLKNYKIR